MDLLECQKYQTYETALWPDIFIRKVSWLWMEAYIFDDLNELKFKVVTNIIQGIRLISFLTLLCDFAFIMGKNLLVVIVTMLVGRFSSALSLYEAFEETALVQCVLGECTVEITFCSNFVTSFIS